MADLEKPQEEPEPKLPTHTVAASVDWLTASSRNGGAAFRLGVYGRHLVTREAMLGNPRLPYAFYGYVGSTAGRASVGTRRDGTLCVVQSELAGEVWRHVFDLADNVSRIDLAVTVWTEKPVHGLAVAGWQANSSWQQGRGRPTRRGVIIDGKGGQTLYLGSRESDWFARLYDKSKQTTDERYANAWRYECEIKGDSARPVADRLSSVADWESAIISTVYDHFASRGVEPIFSTNGNSLRDAIRLDKPSDDRKLQWLSDQVAPSVRELTSRVGLQRIMQALGLPSGLLYTDGDGQSDKRGGESNWQF